jgi:hypothetical protein
MAKGKRRRKNYPTEGTYVEFHGSYSSKGRAVAKARTVKGKYGKGWIKEVRPRGMGRRYVVMTERVPF